MIVIDNICHIESFKVLGFFLSKDIEILNKRLSTRIIIKKYKKEWNSVI